MQLFSARKRWVVLSFRKKIDFSFDGDIKMNYQHNVIPYFILKDNMAEKMIIIMIINEISVCDIMVLFWQWVLTAQPKCASAVPNRALNWCRRALCMLQLDCWSPRAWLVSLGQLHLPNFQTTSPEEKWEFIYGIGIEHADQSKG